MSDLPSFAARRAREQYDRATIEWKTAAKALRPFVTEPAAEKLSQLIEAIAL